MKRKLFSLLLTFVMVFTYMPALTFAKDAPKSKTLSNTEKNSTYGFFVWLSENAATESEKEDAAIAAQIVSNTLTETNKSKVFNSGNIYGGSHDISYEDLLASVDQGGENDATSLENLHAAVNFISSGNSYRAKESLPALKISSALMAMAELNVDYQDINAVFDHSDVFSVMENLAYRQIGGTWQHGSVGGGLSDDPYEGWYTEEKKNYENQSGQTGHYLTLTDRQGAMKLTGFGVRSRYVTTYLTASDGKQYECRMHDRYYSQTFSSKSEMYNVGNGVTPEAYLAYLNRYQCEVNGHTYNEWTVTKAATCTADGLKEHTCTVCGVKATEVIKALGHNWGEWTTSKIPSYTEPGEKQRTCSRCNKVETEAIPKLEMEIILQPEDTTIAAGKKVTFKVTAKGNGLTYQWQYKNAKMSAFTNTNITGNKTDTLSFTASAAFDGIRFRCIVKDADGITKASESALLTIATGPEITSQPEDITIGTGTKATFKVTAKGEGLTYQWQYKNRKMSSFANTNITGNKTDTLSFTASAAFDGIQFRCVVTDTYGASKTSETALLTIVNGPEITSQPEDLTIGAGTKATFKVTAKGEGLTYQWQYKNAKMSAFTNTNITGNKTDTLSFTASAAFNGIQFRCIVKNGDGISTTSDSALLTIAAGPSITSQPEDLRISIGSRAMFRVTAKGEGLTYQWQYKNAKMSGFSNTNITGNKTNTLSFTAGAVYDGIQFRCVITDENGSKVTSQAARLIIVAGPAITTQPKDLEITAGTKAIFTVKASGDGLTYQWQYKNTKMSGFSNTNITGNKTDTLSFNATTTYDGIQFRCIVTDKDGKTSISNAALLTVTGTKGKTKPEGLLDIILKSNL